MYRFRPTLPMRAYPFNEYPTRCRAAAAIMHMVMNNLDPEVAQVRVGGSERRWGQCVCTCVCACVWYVCMREYVHACVACLNLCVRACVDVCACV